MLALAAEQRGELFKAGKLIGLGVIVDHVVAAEGGRQQNSEADVETKHQQSIRHRM